MKVSSGYYKGKSLIIPRTGIKPTSEKVRQALINMYQNRIKGSRFLDLYAGAGSVGIEALSNGAAFACFIENSGRNYMLLKQNLESIVADKNQYRTFKHNAGNICSILTGMENSFDIIFADPYYDTAIDYFDNLFDEAGIFLKSGGIFILEHGKKNRFENNPGHIETRDYGGTCLSIFEKAAEKDK